MYIYMYMYIYTCMYCICVCTCSLVFVFCFSSSFFLFVVLYAHDSCTCRCTSTCVGIHCTCTCTCMCTHVTCMYVILQAPPTKSASMDNFITSTGTTSETDKELINGVNSHSFSGSSGLNFTPKSGSLSSFDEKERENEGRARGEREVEQGNSASSELVHTPVDGNRERQ